MFNKFNCCQLSCLEKKWKEFYIKQIFAKNRKITYVSKMSKRLKFSHKPKWNFSYEIMDKVWKFNSFQLYSKLMLCNTRHINRKEGKSKMHMWSLHKPPFIKSTKYGIKNSWKTDSSGLIISLYNYQMINEKLLCNQYMNTKSTWNDIEGKNLDSIKSPYSSKNMRKIRFHRWMSIFAFKRYKNQKEFKLQLYVHLWIC